MHVDLDNLVSVAGALVAWPAVRDAASGSPRSGSFEPTRRNHLELLLGERTDRFGALFQVTAEDYGVGVGPAH